LTPHPTSGRYVALLFTLIGRYIAIIAIRLGGVIRKLKVKVDRLALLHLRQDQCSNLTTFLVPTNGRMDSKPNFYQAASASFQILFRS
jgi:hypothetical protein